MAGVYVHIPFCRAKCSYCDFYSLANHRLMPEYVGALEREWDARRHELGAERIETIYIGGGTPSVMPADDIARIISFLPTEHVTELTVEANPENIDDATVRAWQSAGVNRVSIGVQSLVDSELKAVGRKHTASRALEAIEILHRQGISNVSADLIYGLPGQTIESWRRSLEGLIQSSVTHLSAYSLSFEPGTRLYRQLQQGIVTEADDGLSADMYRLLCRVAREAGFEHYEISNFAKPGSRSAHNSSYWNLTPYLGLGPGAHSLGADGIRRFTPPDLKYYVNNPEASVQTDEEDDDERFNDLILISLRTSHGLDLSMVDSRYIKRLLQKIGRLTVQQTLQIDGNRIYIPEDRWLTSDAVIRELFV